MAGVPPEDPNRRSRRWWEEGSDPDYRMSLANERTFLAWIRTALALIAGAVALEQLVPSFAVQGVRTTLSVLLAIFGIVAALGAYLHWVRTERAMRTAAPLPRTPLIPALAIGLAVIAVIVAIALLVG